MKVERVYLPNRPPTTLWDVNIEKGSIITSITPSSSPPGSSSPDLAAAPSLLFPSLCHPHIHLDKAFLLTSSHPRYTDLLPVHGSFSEALTSTSAAKLRYSEEDLLLRGGQLILESIRCGVTSMRAFVEVDHVTGLLALETGIKLKRRFAEHRCHVQIAVFAQDPIFSSEHGDENRELVAKALERYAHDIDVLGTTPYVESSHEASMRNIEWAIDTALAKSMHLDFHLDYNLDASKAAMVWDVVRLLKARDWNAKAGAAGKTVVLGHCTRMTLFSDEEMQRLADEIHSSNLPVSFVGLPTSDIFMMGRPAESGDGTGGHRPRGTLQVLQLIHKYGLNAALGINNVGNAFTPWGSVDPLKLGSLGVGLFQDGTEKGAKALLDCVGWRARAAIGLGSGQGGLQSDGKGDEIEEGGRESGC